MTTAEQKSRDMLERIGVEGAQEFSAGALVELANLIAEHEALRSQVGAVTEWQKKGEVLLTEDENNFCSLFGLGAWWADRPWRIRA